MTAPSGYNRLQIGLHWVIAILIGTNYIISDDIPDAFDKMIESGSGGGSFAAGGLHVYIGVAVLALVVLRLVVRLFSGVPEAPEGTPDLLRKSGEWGHLALYALMLAVPAIGALAWFWGIESLGDVHVLAMNAMMILALVHAAAAIYHQFVRQDGLLVRMVRSR